MLGVAVLQVVARNVFSYGFAVGDELVRMSVLWLTMVGAVVATRDRKHISIDVIERFLPIRINRLRLRVADLLTAAICAAIGYFAIDFIGWEIVDRTPGVGQVPAWIFELIIPICAFWMSLRYFFRSFLPIREDDSG